MQSFRLGPDQPNRGGTTYPFVDPPDEHLSALVDLRCVSPSHQFKPPFFITFASGFGDSAGAPTTADLVIDDVWGNELYDTRESTSREVRSWGPGYTAFRWIFDETSVIAVRENRLMVGQPGVLPAVSYHLLANAVRPPIRQITQLEFYRGDDATPHQVITRTGTVRFRGGFNTELSLASPPQRTGSGDKLVTEMGIEVEAGLGEGAFGDCDDAADVPIRTISRSPGDAAGNYRLSADSCFRLEPVFEVSGEVINIEPGMLMMADDCVACCDCDDFMAVYRAMLRLRRRFKIVADRLISIQEIYHELREDLLDRTSCDNGLIKINVVQTGDCVVSAAVSVCNRSGQNADDVMIRLRTIRSVYGGDIVSPGRFAGWSYRAIRYRADQPEGIGTITGVGDANPDDGSYEQIDIAAGCVPNNDTRSVAFTLRFTEPGTYTVCADIISGILANPGEGTSVCRDVDVSCDSPYSAPSTTSDANDTSTTQE